MNKPICVLITNVPDGEIRFVENTYLKLPVEDAFKLIENGYAVGYDPKKKEEINPFLSDEFPMRHILFNNGIYTEEQLKPRLGVVAEFDGIGKKTLKKYNELLFEQKSESESEEESSEELGETGETGEGTE